MMKLGLALSAVVLASVSLGSEFPEAQISNGVITVKLYLPDGEKGYYRGTRFDWSGQIHSLKYKNHEYFGQWFAKYDPKLHDAIMGPVEEFVTDNSSLGYDDAPVGGSFVRIGVGAVRKPEEKGYQRFRTYDIVDGGKWTVRPKGDSVSFVHELSDTNGHAYRYTKTIRLEKGKPEMVLEHSLENRGKKAIRTSQYNHNFFVIDGQPTGTDSIVEFPFTLKPKQPLRGGDAAELQGGRVVYKRELQGRESVFAELGGFGTSASDYNVRIENSKAGAGVRITGDRPLSKVVFWSIRSTFCPEPYIDLNVDSGKKTEWTYRYSFYTLLSSQ